MCSDLTLPVRGGGCRVKTSLFLCYMNHCRIPTLSPRKPVFTVRLFQFITLGGGIWRMPPSDAFRPYLWALSEKYRQQKLWKGKPQNQEYKLRRYQRNKSRNHNAKPNLKSTGNTRTTCAATHTNRRSGHCQSWLKSSLIVVLTSISFIFFNINLWNPLPGLLHNLVVIVLIEFFLS